MQYVIHATTVRRFPIGKRRGISHTSGGSTYELCQTWATLRRFPIGKRRAKHLKSTSRSAPADGTADGADIEFVLLC
jgi:hypothetical protein